MSDWNPAIYSRYEDEPTRPAQELLARVPLTEAARVFDLGCGPGNSTKLLVRRFPGATVVGTDNSEAMLAAACQRVPAAHFELSDIACWEPASSDAAPQLIYANAALQWVPDHTHLIPRLFAALAPGGVLAIQMPDNRDEPTHRLMRKLAAEAPWADAIGDGSKLRTELFSISQYYDLLAAPAAGADSVDVRRTAYQHPMDSAAAIVEWARATGLKPFLDRLPPDLQASYLAGYENRVAKAYPTRTEGKLLLAFPRMFIVAKKL